ncbi:MAG: zinc ribbon domain-containing protein [Armatimonadetes bacterium]|nr:zinc ribbon domain-containing protein [Armatimonadota bacterium]
MQDERPPELPDKSGADRGPDGCAVATTCYRCRATIPQGASHCPRCGRRQTRWCYCGHEIHVTEATCPHCGADWSGALRVRRRGRRNRLETRKLVGYMAAGAVVAIFAAALLNSIVGALAIRSLPAGERVLPPDFASRLGLAVETVGRNLAVVWNHIARLGGGFLGLLAILLTGAVVGALVYLGRVGRIRVPLLRGSKAHRRRRASG